MSELCQNKPQGKVSLVVMTKILIFSHFGKETPDLRSLWSRNVKEHPIDKHHEIRRSEIMHQMEENVNIVLPSHYIMQDKKFRHRV